MTFKKYFRTVQTKFPWLTEFKFSAQRHWRRIRRQPFEIDFGVLQAFSAPSHQWLDIGANRGQSIDAMRLANRATPIVAFEPNPLLAQKLSAQFRADRNLTIQQAGLSDQQGEFELHIPFYGGWMFDGLASFDRQSATEWLKTEIIGFDPKKLEVRRVHCEVKRLDQFDLSPTFVKIDVQGLEASVIDGGARTIERNRPILLVEVPEGWAMPTVMADCGYMPFQYFSGRQGRDMLKAGPSNFRNTVFICPKHLDMLDGSKLEIVN